MARRIVGLNVEKKLLVIPGGGVVSTATCVEDPADCCEQASSGATDCCAGATPAPAVGFAFDGPIAADRSTVTVSGTLDRTGDTGLLYEGLHVGQDIGADISLSVYCAGTEWRAQGVIVLPDYTAPIYYDVRLTVFADLLLGTVEVPGYDNIYLAVAAPCVTSATSWNCVSGACIEVQGDGGTYATLERCVSAGCGDPVGCPCTEFKNFTVDFGSGVNNGGNPNCVSSLRGVRTFNSEPGCNWVMTNGLGGNFPTIVYLDGYIRLGIDSIAIPGAEYVLHDPSWDCRSPVVLPLVNDGVECTDLPSSVTLTPI